MMLFKLHSWRWTAASGVYSVYVFGEQMHLQAGVTPPGTACHPASMAGGDAMLPSCELIAWHLPCR